MTTRRRFLAATAAIPALHLTSELAHAAKGERMQFGLVTYQWGRDWKLNELIKNCEKAQCHGVELRTTHAHKVERSLNKGQREEVRKRFNDSKVTLVGIGSNERYDNPDPAVVKKAIKATKDFIVLSHDVGGTGVKVKPDRFYKNVPRKKTIEQIGKALNELGEFGAGFGQQIRLEVHGQCSELPTIKAILDVAKHDNVAICWNSNANDLKGKGLKHNFNLVRKRFGRTLHCRELDYKKYPFKDLVQLLVATDYEGWVMIEASSRPKDRVKALARQVKLFKQMVKDAQKKLG